jgi:hypothetical protein
MQQVMNAILSADGTPATGGAQPKSKPSVRAGSALPPWQQLALLARAVKPRCADRVLRPRIVLRGNRNYLRQLRAAEMAAWEAAG